MASIIKRGNGWQAKIRRIGVPPISRTFTLRADAETWAKEVELELQRGNVAALRQDALRTTVAELAQRYAEAVLPAMRGKGAAGYVRAASERFGSFFLANVRSVDVGGWRDDLLRSGLSAQSVVHHLNALGALFSFAQKDLSIDLPAGNPCHAVRKPRLPSARDRRLQPGELDYLLRGAAAAQARVVGLPQIIRLGVETSARLSELLALRWSDIDLARRVAKVRGEGGGKTKNGDVFRSVALSSAAVAALLEMPRRIDGRVFGWAAADSFEKAWTRCKARARAMYEVDCAGAGGVPDPAFLADLRFHDLRHEATSRLFEKGLGIMEVASMTGHKSLSMLKRYTHIEAEKLAKKLV